MSRCRVGNRLHLGSDPRWFKSPYCIVASKFGLSSDGASEYEGKGQSEKRMRMPKRDSEAGSPCSKAGGTAALQAEFVQTPQKPCLRVQAWRTRFFCHGSSGGNRSRSGAIKLYREHGERRLRDPTASAAPTAHTALNGLQAFQAPLFERPACADASNVTPDSRNAILSPVTVQASAVLRSNHMGSQRKQWPPLPFTAPSASQDRLRRA